MKKIAVTIKNPEKTSPVSEVFGRCSFFLIHNQETNGEEIISNPFANEIGAAGIQSALLLIESNVAVVITKQIGINPFRLLSSANIKVYQCKNCSAAEAIKLFDEGKLYLLENMNGNIFFGRKQNRRGRIFNSKNNFKNKKGNL